MPYDTLNLGLSTGDKKEFVLENRRRVCEHVGVSQDRMAVAGQVHENKVLEVNAPGLYPGYDGLVTRANDIILCISAADCAAILLADVERGVVGACHAGWRGASAGIVSRTVEMMEKLGARPGLLIAYVGPHICAEHFEVGEEVAAQFDPSYVLRYSDRIRPHVDLGSAVSAQLLDAGLAPESMEMSGDCTFCRTDQFFSHRAEQGKTGRMMGFVGMRKR